jgi:2-polyprenyl-6-methoxyphenol hydroxylase-like FAD-dependent oxidoreductase
LTSGERVRADLLVGADGVHSTVRKSVFGNAEGSAFRYLGMQTAAFIFEDAGIRNRLDRVKLLTVPGRQIGFYPIRGDRVAAFAVHLAPEHTRPSSPVAKIQRIYGGLARISHTVRRIEAPNQRKLLCPNDFRMIRGEPRCRRSVARNGLVLEW